MTTDEEILKAEAKKKLKCPQCSKTLSKRRKGASQKSPPLAIGVRACHGCESVWLIHKIGR